MRLINNVLASAVLIYKYTIDRITNPISFFKVFENIDKAFREYWQGFLFESKKYLALCFSTHAPDIFLRFCQLMRFSFPRNHSLLMYVAPFMQISCPDILSKLPDFHHCTADLLHVYNYEKA